MAGASLLLLLDDIAAVLDDVATMTKVAARKTAGVLGDDLALNAQQVSGVDADRELPVVWAVAKGSMKNKLILVPAALLISAFIPWLITPLLMAGGLFLCFEGAEKLLHSLLPHADSAETKPDADSASPEMERDKIAGAIRTDFILSAEIIVIALGTVASQPLSTQLAVLALVAVVMTIGVYGLVAGIVKLDDAGLALCRKPAAFSQLLGRGLLALAPRLMRLLALAGTVAMFMVGGGILSHGIPLVHHLIADWASVAATLPAGAWWSWLAAPLLDAVFGLLAGLLAAIIWQSVARLRH